MFKNAWGQFTNNLLDFDNWAEHFSSDQGAMGMGLLARRDQSLGDAAYGALGDLRAQQAERQAYEAAVLANEQAAQDAENERIERERMQQMYPDLAGLPQHMQQAEMQRRIQQDRLAQQNVTLGPGGAMLGPDGKLLYRNPFKPEGQGNVTYVGPNGETYIGPAGAMPTTFGTKGNNALDAKTIGAIEALGNLRRVAQSYQPGYLTYYGKGKKAALNFADKLGFDIGKDGAAFLGGAEQFKNSVDQFFNAYRSEITGAAASDKELQRLKTTMINSDMGDTQFQYSFQAITQAMQQNLALYTRLKAQGGLSEAEIERLMDEQYYTVDADLNVVQANDPNKSMMPTQSQTVGGGGQMNSARRGKFTVNR